MAQQDWMTANSGRVITLRDMTSLTNTAYQASFTAKNVTAAFAKLGIWPFSRLAFSDEDLSHHLLPLLKKNFVSRRFLFLLLASP